MRESDLGCLSFCVCACVCVYPNYYIISHRKKMYTFGHCESISFYNVVIALTSLNNRNTKTHMQNLLQELVGSKP